MKNKGVIIAKAEGPIGDSDVLYEGLLNQFHGGFGLINVLGRDLRVIVGDILVLSPATFGDPIELEYDIVTEIKNPKTDDPNFQIRTARHFWDFRNFYNVIGVYRPVKNEITTEIIQVNR